MIIVRLLSPEPVGWIQHHQLYPVAGADTVMESIALTIRQPGSERYRWFRQLAVESPSQYVNEGSGPHLNAEELCSRSRHDSWVLNFILRISREQRTSMKKRSAFRFLTSRSVIMPNLTAVQALCASSGRALSLTPPKIKPCSSSRPLT